MKNSEQIPEELQELSRRAYIAAECSGLTDDQFRRLLSCLLSVGVAICPDYMIINVEEHPRGIAYESDLRENCATALKAYESMEKCR